MREAKKQITYYKMLAASGSWVPSADSLAMWTEDLFVRPTRRDHPTGYVKVEDHRRLRLAIIGDLLDHPDLASFNDLTEIERRALASFLSRTTNQVLGEVKAEYVNRSQECLSECSQDSAEDRDVE